jgi:signal transduction histidine kinase
LEQQVAERTADLKEIIGELEKFSYTMAHDLRGPLRSMQGYANILLEDHAEQLDEAGKRYVSQVAASADRLHKLVTEVLAFTRLTREALPLQPVDLVPLIEAVVEANPSLNKVGIIRPAQLPIVFGNSSALTQAISNLLTNAVKFVPPQRAPRVEISAEESDAFVTLFIRDNGIGIADEDQSRIFRMFERVRRADNYEGTGMGLAIVQRAVERMGADVGVISRIGEGSTFWMKLRRPPSMDKKNLRLETQAHESER